MPTPEKLFKERAAVLIRDLKKGWIKPSEVDEYIAADWEKDEDEYADAYGVRSFPVFKRGVRAILDKRPAGKKTKPTTKKGAKPPSSGNTGRRSVPGPAKLDHAKLDTEMRRALAALQQAKRVPEPSRFARAVARAREALRRFH
jgi:hypothetical protein